MTNTRMQAVLPQIETINGAVMRKSVNEMLGGRNLRYRAVNKRIDGKRAQLTITDDILNGKLATRRAHSEMRAVCAHKCE